MSLDTTLALIVILTVAVVLFFRKKYSYWNNKNIKCLPVVPLLGSQYENVLQKETVVHINDKIYRKYRDDKYVAGYRGLVPELHVFDPELIRVMLVKDFNYFVDRDFPASEKEPITQHLFGLKGQKWRILRQKLSPTFTSAKMRQMFPLMVENSKGLENIFSEVLKKSSVQEIKGIMARFTTDTIGSCAFGLNMNSLADENGVFRRAGIKLFEPSRVRLLVLFLYGLMPKVLEFFKLTSFALSPLGTEKFFVNFMKQLIAMRKNSPSKRHDFVDMMLELRKEEQLNGNDKANVDDIKFTDELMTAQSFIFFGAGFETSSSVMSYALYELAKHPDVQDKLQNEIDEILEKHGGEISYEAVQEMTYLECVIKEALRMYPAAPFLMRVCNSTYKIPGSDLVIDDGVNITIPLYSLHHDEKYFPDPETFQPERFIDESNIHPYSYMPFGEGPRNCIGMRFGKLQAAVGLITTLKDYSVEKCEKTPDKLQYDTSTLALTPIGGIHLRIVPRK